jgi:hypothetical protein
VRAEAHPKLDLPKTHHTAGLIPNLSDREVKSAGGSPSAERSPRVRPLRARTQLGRALARTPATKVIAWRKNHALMLADSTPAQLLRTMHSQ